MEYSERASTSSYYRGRMGEPDLYHARMGEPEAHREGKEEADDYLEKLLELKEDRCRRLQDLIALKEARLAQLRGAAASPTPEAPPTPPPPSPPPPPPAVRRNSFSMVPVNETTRNSAPLGKLQPGGRREYLPMTLSPAPSVTSRRGRAALQPSGLPREVVRRWQSGAISPDLAMREILDAVCRCSSSSAAPEERELSTMTQLYTTNGAASLGGALGGIVGGLPAERAEVSAAGGRAEGKAEDLCPLRHVLGLPVEAVTNEALDLFAR